jgi:DNA-binding HxlR family transcriptional regulator
MTTDRRCAVLGTLDVLGDIWTLGILRCVFYGQRRYTQIQRQLGIATNVLADRLDSLVEADLLARVPYQDRPLRHEYVPTARGAELATVIVALREWGRRNLEAHQALPPLTHAGCGGSIDVSVSCTACRAVVPADGIAIRDSGSDAAIA